VTSRCYRIDDWAMKRAACYCERCGVGYQEDTITDELGPRSAVRSACDCTPAGRRPLRGPVAIQEPILMEGTLRATATAPATPAPITSTGNPI
jgi:hypothetical protein